LGNPHAQLLWGQALIRAGKKHGDLSLIQKGWTNVREAREEARKQAERKTDHTVTR
jgi:hypothetical protein